MKSCYTVSLRLWIPFLLLGVFVVVWGVFAWQQRQTMRAEAIKTSLRFVTQDLRSLQREINNYHRDQSPIRAEQSLTARGVDTSYHNLAALDQYARVLYSLHFQEKDSQATSVFRRFDPELFHQTRDRNRTDISFNPETERIIAYLPLRLSFSDANPRWQNTGAIYADYSLKEELSQIWSNFLRSSATISFAIFVAVISLGAFLHFMANRPIQSLVQGAERIASGNWVRLQSIRGNGELAELAKAFDHMSDQLAIREEQLVSSEARYRALVEDQTEAVVRLNPDGKIAFANTAFLDLSGKQHGEIVGQEFTQVIGFSEPSTFRHKLAELTPETKVVECEQEIQTSEGTKVITWVVHGIYDSAGALSDILVTGRDTTEQNLLTESFRRVIEASPVALVITNKGGIILQANQAAEDTFGYSSSEMVGSPVETLIPQRFHDRHTRKREQFTAAPESRRMGPNLELFARHKSGKEIPVEVALRPVALINEHVIIAAVVDISERKLAERQRRQLEAQLQQQQRLESIGTLAGGVAHEINNPIQGIMSYAQLISDDLPPESPLQQFCHEISEETERVAGIVRNLLSFARDREEPLSAQSIPEILERTLTLIRTIIRKDHIQLTVSAEEALPPVQGRGQQLQQVMMNLLTNSRDALNQKFPEPNPEKALNIRIARHTEADRPWLRTTVEDRGCGIAPALRERIFDPFFSTKTRSKGTGLGLTISHNIVEKHGGRIVVESEVGAFTRFHVDLPITTARKKRNVTDLTS